MDCNGEMQSNNWVESPFQRVRKKKSQPSNEIQNWSNPNGSLPNLTPIIVMLGELAVRDKLGSSTFFMESILDR